MDCFFKPMKKGASGCALGEQDIQRCPFLRNINEATSFSFLPMNFTTPQPLGSRGPIFEDGPNFDMAFKLFHGKDGVIPLDRRSNLQYDHHPEPDAAPVFNPLAAKAATISLSGFGPGGPFSFDSFSEKWKKIQKKAEPSKKRDHKPQPQGEDSSAKHEALGDEWLKYGNCPIAKSYRAVNYVVPLVAKALQPPPGMKIRCPPAIVAARAALAKTELAKNLRPQPLPAKMFAIAALGMAANVPLGVWREHTRKFSPSWFMAVHAAVPFIAMLRKAILMPKSAMVLTIGASILGQAIGARAERLRMKSIAEAPRTAVVEATRVSALERSTGQLAGVGGDCGKEEMIWVAQNVKQDDPGTSRASVCF